MKLPATKKLKKSELPYDLGHILNHAQRVLQAPILDDVKEQIRKIGGAHLDRMAHYGFAGRIGHTEVARKWEYQLCTSFGSRIVAVLIGHPKHAPKLTWEQVKSRANFVNPRVPSLEKVIVTTQPKPEGGERMIQKFGKISRANQSLARDIVTARHGVNKTEYARKGRGRDKLMQGINNANKNGGVRALGTADVENCFPSMRRVMIRRAIRISSAIINNTIFVPDETPIYMEVDHISELAVRNGLSQGSLSSPVVASKVIEACLEPLSARFLGSYSDNIAIGEKSVEEVQATLDALADALKHWHPDAPLFLKYSRSLKIGEHVDFVGNWPRPNSPDFGGGLRFSPSNTSLRRFYVKVATLLLQLPQSAWEAILEEKAYAYAASAKSWSGALGAREFMQSAFIDYLAGSLDDAHQKVLNAIDAGFSKANIQAMARNYASELIPDVVLANEWGLCETVAS